MRGCFSAVALLSFHFPIIAATRALVGILTISDKPIAVSVASIVNNLAAEMAGPWREMPAPTMKNPSPSCEIGRGGKVRHGLIVDCDLHECGHAKYLGWCGCGFRGWCSAASGGGGRGRWCCAAAGRCWSGSGGRNAGGGREALAG